MLTDVLAGFSSQMESMFGGQMRGMNEMLVQTANTIQAASQRFEQLAGQIQQAGSGAADAMAKRMDEALQQMQARQSEANEQMRVFIDQLRDNVSKGQSESAELTMGMMKELSESTSELVKSLQQQAHQANEGHSSRQADAAQQMQALIEQMKESATRGQNESSEATAALLKNLGDSTSGLFSRLSEQANAAQQVQDGRHAELTAKTAEMLGRQSEQLGDLTTAVQLASSAMRESIDRIQTATNANIERMGTGAQRLHDASQALGNNLELMTVASSELGTGAQQIGTSMTTLSTALTATQQALGEHRAVRDALAAMVADLRTTVETAKREASMTSELVNSLQVASQRLSEAQKAADSYLDGVTEVMGEAHGAFAKQMEATMREGNRVFHEELAQATGLLKGAIQDLGDVFDTLPQAA